METIATILVVIAALGLIVVTFNLCAFENGKSQAFREAEIERRKKWIDEHRHFWG